jgi:uncharacterized protein with HEPN domain
MERDDKVYLKDILESIAIIEEFIGKKTEKQFLSDLLLQDGVTRRFEIIGEAVSKISSATKKKNPTIEWGLMKSMRNKLIHEYFGVSPATIYNTVKLDLPKVKRQIKTLLKDLGKS